MLKTDETIPTKATKEENKQIRQQRKKQRMALEKVLVREKFQKLSGSYRCPHLGCSNSKRSFKAAAFLNHHMYSNIFLKRIHN